MNSFKLMLRFTGVLAAATIAATPLAAWAQTPQSKPPERPRIEFTQDQQVKFEKLQAETIAQIYSTLSKEQREQLEAGLRNGQGFKNVDNLTDSQKTQIQGILEKMNQGIDEILTEEQKAQIREFYMRNQQNQPNQK